MLMTQTIDGLLRAIDAGHDDTLLILADALEEAGDPLAAGLRRLAKYFAKYAPTGVPTGVWPWPYNLPTTYGYGRRDERVRWVAGRKFVGGLPRELFDELEGGRLVTRTALARGVGWSKRLVRQRCYPTRSAAFLALAEVLASRHNSPQDDDPELPL